MGKAYDKRGKTNSYGNEKYIRMMIMTKETVEIASNCMMSYTEQHGQPWEDKQHVRRAFR